MHSQNKDRGPALLTKASHLAFLLPFYLCTSGSFGQDLSSLEQSLVSVIDSSQSSIVPVLIHRHRASSSLHQECLFRVTSAVVVNSSGLLAMSASVLQPDAIFEAVIREKRWPATLRGFDVSSGIAALQIDPASGVKPAARAETTELKAGRFVVALAYSQAVLPHVALGVLGGLGQSIQSKKLDQFLQFAPFGPLPEEGAPILDLEGRWIGFLLNSCSPMMCSALPLNSVLEVAAQLEKQGEVFRPWLGMTVEGPNLRLGSLAGLNGEAVLKIVGIEPASPAALAGLQPGDRILALNGVMMKSLPEMMDLLKQSPPQAAIVLRLERSGTILQIEFSAGARSGKTELTANLECLGLVLAKNAKKQLVVRVAKRPELGFEANDCLVALDDQPIEDARQIEETLLRKPLDQKLIFRVLRQDTLLHLELTPGLVRMDPGAMLYRLLRIENTLAPASSDQ